MRTWEGNLRLIHHRSGWYSSGGSHILCLFLCFKIFILVFKSLFISVWVSCMCVCAVCPCVQVLGTLHILRSQRKMLPVLLDHTPPYTPLSLNLGLFWQTASPSDLPISAPPPALNLPAILDTFAFLNMCSRDLNPGPYACMSNTWPSEPFPQSQLLILFFFFFWKQLLFMFVMFLCFLLAVRLPLSFHLWSID